MHVKMQPFGCLVVELVFLHCIDFPALRSATVQYVVVPNEIFCIYVSCLSS